jgi:hypothetical protein
MPIAATTVSDVFASEYAKHVATEPPLVDSERFDDADIQAKAVD